MASELTNRGAASSGSSHLPWSQQGATQGAFRAVLGVMVLVSVTIVALILIFLAIYSLPAIRFNGLNIITGTTWSIGNQYGSGVIRHNGVVAQSGAQFGGFVFIFGTLATSALAMVFAVPISILVALALAYRIPSRVRFIANALVELMAGVPSVVYGLWGVVVLVPWIGGVVAPAVTSKFGNMPVLGGGAGSGNGLFAASIVLALMVIPIMVATMRDVILSQPASIFEASMALGSTSWQAVTKAVLPGVRNGFVASILVALGRALGETMAVLMVSGAAINQYPANIFQAVNTIAAVIVSQLDSALTDTSGIAEKSLSELALLLFLITLAVNIIARATLRGRDRLVRVR